MSIIDEGYRPSRSGGTPPQQQMPSGMWEGAVPFATSVGEKIQTFEESDWNPFDTWGQDKPVLSKGIDTFLSVAGSVAKIPWYAMSAVGTVQLQVIDRPVSTLLQATTLDNPLYGDGVSWDDFKRMWNASEEEIGFGRAWTTNLAQIPRIAGEITGLERSDGYANYLSGAVGLDPDFNPYALTPEQRHQLNNNAVYNLGTGFADLGYDVSLGVLGDKGIGSVRRLAGLSRNMRTAEDLRALTHQIDVHQDPAVPSTTIIGEQVDRIAETSDINVIRSQGVTNGIRTPGILYALQRETDPVRVGKIIRAAHGDVKAIGELTTDRPDVAWVIGGADGKIAEAIADGWRVTEDPDGQLMLEAATDAMFQNDPGAAAMRELFWQKTTKGPRVGEFKEAADGSFVPRVETTKGVLGASTRPDSRLAKVGEKAAALQIDARTGWRVAQGAEMPDTPGWATRLIGTRGITPVVRLISWMGEELPKQTLTLSPDKPEDAAREMVAQTREMSAWSTLKGKRTVTFIDQSGKQIKMTQAERIRDIEDRLLYAQANGGEVDVIRTIRQIEEENLSVLFHQRGKALHLSNEDFDRIVASVVQANGRGHGRVQFDDIVLARDGDVRLGKDSATTARSAQPGGGGYYVDADGTKVDIDALTIRGLANSWVTLPMRQIEDAVVRHYSGLKGRAKAAQIVGRQVRDTTYGIARASMLMRLGYIPKNSMLDPWFARMFALGEVFGPDGAKATMSRFAENMGRRLVWFDDALRRGLVPSSRLSTKERELARAWAQVRDIEDDIKAIQDEIDSLQNVTDPVLIQQRDDLTGYIKDVRATLAGHLSDMDLKDPSWRLSPPTFDTLHEIGKDVEWMGRDLDTDLPTLIDSLLSEADGLTRKIGDQTAILVAEEANEVSVLAAAWKGIADGSGSVMPLEDLVPATLAHLSRIKASRLGDRAEVSARLASIGIPEMPLVQRMIQDFWRYQSQYVDLPEGWDLMDDAARNEWLRDWLHGPEGQRTPWGRNYPLHRIDAKTQSETNRLTETVTDEDGDFLEQRPVFAPAGVLADSEMVQPGMVLYRAMGVQEFESGIVGAMRDGRKIETDLSITGSMNAYWSVEGLGRAGQQQTPWWSGISPEMGGGFGSFYDNPTHPIVVEAVIVDPQTQVVGRKEMSNPTSYATAYSSNIGGDWEKRVRPGSYIQITRAWRPRGEPTGRDPYSPDTDIRVPIAMGKGETLDPHWEEIELPNEAHAIIDVENSTFNYEFKIGDSAVLRRVQGGSWLRERELIDRDLASASMLEAAVEAFMSGDGSPLLGMRKPTVTLPAGKPGVARLGTASVWETDNGDVWGSPLAPKQWSKEQREHYDGYWASKQAQFIPGFRFAGASESLILSDAAKSKAAREAARDSLVSYYEDTYGPQPFYDDDLPYESMTGTPQGDAVADAFLANIINNPDALPEELVLDFQDAMIDAIGEEATDFEIMQFAETWIRDQATESYDPGAMLPSAADLGITLPVEPFEPPDRWSGVPIVIQIGDDGSLSFPSDIMAGEYLAYRREFGGMADVPIRTERLFADDPGYATRVPLDGTRPVAGKAVTSDATSLLEGWGLQADPHPTSGPIHTVEYLGKRSGDDWAENGPAAEWLSIRATGDLLQPEGIANLFDAQFRVPMSEKTDDWSHSWNARGSRWTMEDRDSYDLLKRREAFMEARLDLGDDYDLRTDFEAIRSDYSRARTARDQYLASQTTHKKRVADGLTAAQRRMAEKVAEADEARRAAGVAGSEAGALRTRLESLRRTTLSGNGRVFVNPRTGKTMYREDWTTDDAVRAGFLETDDAYSAQPGVPGTAFRASMAMSHTYNAQEDPFGMRKVRRREDRLRRSVGQGRAIPETDPFYFDALEMTVNRHIRGDLLGEAMLRGATDEEIARLLDTPAGVEYRRLMEWDESAWNPPILPYDQTDASLLHYRTNKIRNLRDLVDTYLPNDIAVPPEILARHGMPAGTSLHALVSAVELTRGEMEQTLRSAGRPLRLIHGNDWVSETMGAGERMADWQQTIWEQMMVKPETRIGSNPAAVSFYRRSLGRQARLLYEQGVDVTPDTLEGLQATARREAMEEAFQTVYHIDRNRRWMRAAGNVTAFPAAYANAITRYTRMAINNPGRAAMLSQFLETGMNPDSWWWSGNDPQAIQVQDKEGNVKPTDAPVADGDRILVSVPEWMKSALPPGMTEGFTITPKSLALFGQAPSAHPYVGTATRAVYSQEELEAMLGKGTADALFPFGLPEGFVESALPGWLSGATSEFDITSSEIQRQFTSDLIAWEKAGMQGPVPTWEQSHKRLQDGALMRFALKFSSPPGLGATKEGSMAMAQYRNIQAKHSGDRDRVQQEWSRLFPNVPVPLSATNYGEYGFIPSTRAAKDTLEGNIGLVRSVAAIDPSLVSVLTIGAEGEFDGTISGWLRENSFAPGAEPYLVEKNPVEAAADAKRAEGWAEYQKVKAQFDYYLATQGLSSRSKAAEPARMQFEQWKQAYGAYNPAWYGDYVDGINVKAPGVISTMGAALSDPQFMAQQQRSGDTTWETVSWWMEAYQGAKQAYAVAQTTDERNLIQDQFDEWTATTLLPREDGFKRLYQTYLDDGRALVGGGY